MNIPVTDANISQDEEILDFDPEFADMGNPSGAIYHQVLRVTAATKAGRRFIHGWAFSPADYDQAQALANRVEARGVIDLQHWNETYEIYGSAAWQHEDNMRAAAHALGPLAGTVRDY